MKIIVQKFGGTSVATPQTRQLVVKKVKEAVDGGYAPIVVVSAMGRRGDPYATDTLIEMLRSVNPDPDVHELDLMMACGEIISSTVMASTLQKEGFKAKALTGGQAGMVTDGNFGNAKIKTVRPKTLKTLVEQGIIPVICGFQGVTDMDGSITTLGRGGSDTSAAAFGVAVDAEKVEIYTDVDGVMTADPALFPMPRSSSRFPMTKSVKWRIKVPRSSIPAPLRLSCDMGYPWSLKAPFLMHRVPLSRRMTRLIPWKVRMMLKAIMPVELPASRIFPSSKWTCRRIRPIMAAGSLKIWLLTVSALGV